MRIEIPANSFVALVGISSSGKSTFAKKHFFENEILSSDYFRGMLTNDENTQSVNEDVFETLYYIANKRLKRNLLTVIDATNLQRDARKKVLLQAKDQYVTSVAIVINTSLETAKARHELRDDRSFGVNVLTKQSHQLRKSINKLKREGFRYVFVIEEDDLNNVEIIRNKLRSDKNDESGPYDIIGDVHGCYDELCILLDKCGYDVDKDNHIAVHNERQAIFLGDLCDRGPKNVDVLKLVMNMVKTNNAYCISGNHDKKLERYLDGRNVTISHGLDLTINQLENESEQFCIEVKEFLSSLVSHYCFDDLRLVVSHAGIKEEMQGKASRKVREFCLYGDVDGSLDSNGKPKRKDWTKNYRGNALVVYGHTVKTNIANVNNTLCIDTGCVYGGKLSAYKYPENKIVSIDALSTYFEDESAIDLAVQPNILKIEDVLHKRYFSTTIYKNILIDIEQSAKAFEVINQYAVSPQWLIYLPPTMSPAKTSSLSNYLEHPIEAIDYFRENGVREIICEEKHMGSRAVIVLCKNKTVAKERFSIEDDSIGVIYSRTGRPFFNNKSEEKEILDRLNKVLEMTNFWEDYNTGWVCIDSEIMPWSLKAKQLIKDQYASTGCSASNSLTKVLETVEAAKTVNPIELDNLTEKYKTIKDTIEPYKEAYRAYCWDVESINDYKIAPFHILATEGKVWTNVNHKEHMETIYKYICEVDNIFIKTKYKIIDVDNQSEVDEVIAWWIDHTANKGEGIVFKPLNYVTKINGKLIQPAIKCRGKEYLRIIYGPTYTLDASLDRLKNRGLKRKRALALSEFALGIESLQRFVDRRALYEIHESAFAVLALESESVDPRL